MSADFNKTAGLDDPPRSRRAEWLAAAYYVAAFLVGRPALAETPPVAPAEAPPGVTVDADGTVHIPAMAIPFSSFASDEARKAFVEWVKVKSVWGSQSAKSNDEAAGVAQSRRNLEDYYAPFLERAVAAFPVNIESQTIGGVYTDMVTPKDGISARNKDRVLIELHSGGFFTGARILGKLDAVPISGLGKIKIYAVDYREGPEARFPAASEDVATVYKELLKHYKPRNIGIFGCSAGGLLASSSVAWFLKEHLPLPGAIGVMCSGATGWRQGDSAFTGLLLDATLPPPEGPRAAVNDARYLKNVENLKDPLVAPGWSPEILKKFPPTFFITGTRDMAMSSALFSHIQMVKAGVDSHLYVWDGMNHDFFTDVRVPESMEAYTVIWNFFDKHLGGR